MATGQQNINIGTADNANDGDVLRAAFRKVRKMFAEIYGDTDAENLTDTETVPSTSFDTHITEKIEDTVASMFSGGTHSNITVVYDDSDGTLDLDVSADIDSVTTAANSGLDGGVQDGDATLSLDLNNLSSATVDVAADSIGIVDASDSNNTKKETIADVVDAVAGSGLTATNGVLSVDSIDTDAIANDAVDGTKLQQFDDTLTATTAGHIIVSNGTNFIHREMTGVIDISSTGATTFDANVDGDGLTNTSGVLSVDVDDDTIEIDATNGIQVKADGIDHDQLAARYTAKNDISTTTGTINLECDDYSVFELTGDLGTCTLSLNDLKTGQVVDVICSGSDLSSAVITLDTDFTTDAINKIGTSDFDTSATNHLQFVCVDDTDSDAIVNYTVSSYAAQTNPAS